RGCSWRAMVRVYSRAMNPYAPPQPVQQPVQSQGPGGPQQPWEFGEALGVAWRAYTENAAVVILAPIVAGLILLVPVGIFFGVMMALLLNGSFEALGRPEFQLQMQGIGLGISIISVLVATFFEVGLTKIWVAAARGESPGFGMLFSGGNRYLAM